MQVLSHFFSVLVTFRLVQLPMDLGEEKACSRQGFSLQQLSDIWSPLCLLTAFLIATYEFQ